PKREEGGNGGFEKRSYTKREDNDKGGFEKRPYVKKDNAEGYEKRTATKRDNVDGEKPLFRSAEWKPQGNVLFSPMNH
ncbi:MAG: hypothetical protein HYZ42_03935, partial [Bacteroidetes bacterium]|nr:hypothetical protein [Bacteroidota bacterium]